MSNNVTQSVKLPNTATSHYFSDHSALLGTSSWTASQALQPPQFYNSYDAMAAESLFATRQYHGDSHMLPQQQYVSNEHDENANYLRGTNLPAGLDQEPLSQQQQQEESFAVINGAATASSPSHQLAGTPSGGSSEEADGSYADTASNDGGAAEGDGDDNDDDEGDSSSKLEKSRQSARECRARKKLRYQYLESLVDARKQSVAQLKEELAQFEMYAKLFDHGEVPPGLMELMDDKTTVSGRQVGSAIGKDRLNKVSGRSAKAAAPARRAERSVTGTVHASRAAEASNIKHTSDVAVDSSKRNKKLRGEAY